MNLLRQIAEVNPSVHIKGGYVRDQLLGLESRDIDFVIEGDYEEQLALFAEAFDWAIPTGASHGTFMFKHFGEKYECTVCDDVTNCGSKSDFTINSLLMNADGNIIDNHDGQSDLLSKTIRVVDLDSLSNDCIRVVRGIRFSRSLGFRIDDDTWELMHSAAKDIHFLENITKYRSWNEISKIMKLDNAVGALASLELLGVKMPFKSWTNVDNNNDYISNLSKSLQSLSKEERAVVYKDWGIKVVDRKAVEEKLC